jgi:hypothetical protein
MVGPEGPRGTNRDGDHSVEITGERLAPFGVRFNDPEGERLRPDKGENVLRLSLMCGSGSLRTGELDSRSSKVWRMAVGLRERVQLNSGSSYALGPGGYTSGFTVRSVLGHNCL